MGKKKTLDRVLKDLAKETKAKKEARVDMKKLMKGDKPIKVYSGSVERPRLNTWQSFIEDAKELDTTPEIIAKTQFKNQWFTPFESYAKMFTSPKELKSKMRTVDLSPKEIESARRYVEKVNKTHKLASMRKKLGIDKGPLHNITTDEGTVIIPRYKLKQLEKAKRIKTDYMILEKIKKKLGLAEGGIAGQLHLNQGGRARFDNGGMSQTQLVQMYMEQGMSYNDAVQAASASQSLPWHLLKAEGGRIGFDNGGMSRRNFLKLMGGLASIPILGKFFKLAKPATKVMTAVEKSNAAGMPAWFPKLVDKVMKEGKDVTKQYGTTERVVVKEAELPGSKTKVLVEQDLTTGDTVVDIGFGKHGWVDGRHGQPTRLHLQKGEWIEPKKGKKKGIKTKDEFAVEEAEFTGDGESVKFEETVSETYGNHASDFTEVEKYATGKNIDKKIVGSKRARDDWAEGHAEAMAEQVDEFAKGGLAGVLRL
jgi:hypothetical protein